MITQLTTTDVLDTAAYCDIRRAMKRKRWEELANTVNRPFFMVSDELWGFAFESRMDTVNPKVGDEAVGGLPVHIDFTLEGISFYIATEGEE